MSTHPDPFDAYGPPKQDGQIFSVLAPCVGVWVGRGRQRAADAGLLGAVWG